MFISLSSLQIFFYGTVDAATFRLFSNEGQTSNQAADRCYLINGISGAGVPALLPPKDPSSNSWNSTNYVETDTPAPAGSPNSRWDTVIPIRRYDGASSAAWNDGRYAAIINAGADWIWFNNQYPGISLLGDAPSPAPAYPRRYNGVNYNNGYGAENDTGCYIRKTFCLPLNLSGVTACTLRMTADNSVRAFMNSTFYYQHADWATLAVVRITNVRPGKNVMSFCFWETTGNWSAGLYQANVHYNPTAVDLVANASNIIYSSNRLSAVVSNRGSASCPAGARVSFYNGNPTNGGVQIGTNLILRAIPASGTNRVSIGWSLANAAIYVVVDSYDALGRPCRNLGGRTNLLGGKAVFSNNVYGAIGRIRETNEANNVSSRVFTRELVAGAGMNNAISEYIRNDSLDMAMLQLKITNWSTNRAFISRISFRASGSGDEPVHVTNAELYADNNNNGMQDAGDTKLDSSLKFSADNGLVTFSNLSRALNAKSNANWLVVYDYSGAAGAGSTFQLSFLSNSYLRATNASGGRMKVEGAAVPGGTKTIGDKASVIVYAGAGNPADSKVLSYASNLVMVQVRLYAANIENVNVTGLRLKASGTADDSADITKADLYLDVNNNGTLERGTDAALFTNQTCSADNGILNFTNFSFILNAFRSTNLIMVYRLAGTAVSNETFQAAFSSNQFLSARGTTTLSNAIVNGAPVSGGLMTVRNKGILRLTAGANNHGDNDIYNDQANLEMIQLRLSADDFEDIVITNIKFKGSGTGNDQNDIFRIDLYVDVNSNGFYDQSLDIPVATNRTYTADNGYVQFSSVSCALAKAGAVHWLLVYDMAGTAPTNTTFSAAVTNILIRARGSLSQSNITPGGGPVSSGTKTVVARVFEFILVSNEGQKTNQISDRIYLIDGGGGSVNDPTLYPPADRNGRTWHEIDYAETNTPTPFGSPNSRWTNPFPASRNAAWSALYPTLLNAGADWIWFRNTPQVLSADSGNGTAYPRRFSGGNYNNGYVADANTAMYIRKPFCIPLNTSGTPVIEIKVTTDNWERTYMNTNLLGRNGQWNTLSTYTNSIRKGKNVLAFCAWEQAGVPTATIYAAKLMYTATTVDLNVLPSDIFYRNGKLYATIRNLGGSACPSNVIAGFYKGDPMSGGSRIGTNLVLPPFPGYGITNISVNWTFTNNTRIYVVLDAVDSCGRRSRALAGTTNLLGGKAGNTNYVTGAIGRVQESVETNNTASAWMRVGALKVTNGPNDPAAGDVMFNATNVVMLQIALRCNSNENVILSNISFNGAGTGNEATAVTNARIYRDINRNGLLDAGDVMQSAGAKFASDNGRITFSNINLTLSSSTTNFIILVYNFNGSAMNSDTFQSRFTNNSDLLARGQRTGQAATVTGAVVSGSVRTVIGRTPRVAISKSVTPCLAKPYESVSYTIKYSNITAFTSFAFSVIEVMPGSMQLVTNSAESSNSPHSGVVTVTYATDYLTNTTWLNSSFDNSTNASGIKRIRWEFGDPVGGSQSGLIRFKAVIR